MPKSLFFFFVKFHCVVAGSVGAAWTFEFWEQLSDWETCSGPCFLLSSQSKPLHVSVGAAAAVLSHCIDASSSAVLSLTFLTSQSITKSEWRTPEALLKLFYWVWVEFFRCHNSLDPQTKKTIFPFCAKMNLWSSILHAVLCHLLSDSPGAVKNTVKIGWHYIT